MTTRGKLAGNAASPYYFSLLAVLAMACYQIVLCYLNTHVLQVTNGLVAATEGTILTCVLASNARSMTPGRYLIAVCIAIYVLFEWMCRGDVDLFAPRCLLIIFSFYMLGGRLKNPEQAERILWALSIIVILFALAEYFFTPAYLNLFNILRYNISRGMTSTDAVEYMSQSSAVNGVRFSGRNLLPFLGDQRVSSIFLEPVSMGNYAIIVTIWFLSFDVAEWRRKWGHLAAGIFLVIASDSRFASMSIFFLFIARLVPQLQSRVFVFASLFLAIGFLGLFAYLHLGEAAQDNLTGRLARSGDTLLSIDFLSAFGLNVPRNLGDMGMSFSIENFGLILVIVLWAGFSFMPMRSNRGMRFRALTAFYALSILMISGTSFYSSKTASILWLLLGVLNKPASGAWKTLRSKERPAPSARL